MTTTPKPKQSEAEQIAAVDALLTMGREYLVDVLVVAMVKAKREQGLSLDDLEKALNRRQLLLVQAIAAVVSEQRQR